MLDDHDAVRGDDDLSRPQLHARAGPWGVVAVSLLAGWMLIAAEMAVSSSFLGTPLLPWRAAASVVIGSTAMEFTARFPVFIVGLIVHFGLAVVFGGAYILGVRRLLRLKSRMGLGREIAMGAFFGFVLWLVNFQILGRLFFPWLTALPQVPQLLMHVLAFGIPLGMMLSSVERRILYPPDELVRT